METNNLENQISYLASYFNLTLDQIRMKCRKREIVVPRQMIVAQLSLQGYTKRQISLSLGYILKSGEGDHSTVVHHIYAVQCQCDVDKRYKDNWDLFCKHAKMYVPVDKSLEFLAERY